MMIAMAFIMIWQMSRRRFNFHWISRRLGKNQRPTHSPSNRFCGEKADSAPERTDPSALDAPGPAFVDPVMRGRTGRVCGGGSCGRPPRVSWGLDGFFVLSRVLDAFVKFLRGNYLVSGGREGWVLSAENLHPSALQDTLWRATARKLPNCKCLFYIALQ